ncbi:MAG: cupin domain-containing protein [Aquabacterium sp.]|uniref:cupin domain-containing protein n=1 Tax=Aquabacterium sp. TaxID=1872578 RepID=UPI003BC596DE
MRIHDDFSCTVEVVPDEHVWVPSPQPGVSRMMLDRMGAEHARATSLVRYEPGASFAAHSHPGGEEILVLDGTFSDESADYPAGWYLRNPAGSAHQPHSATGALIFVKLWQMDADDAACVRLDTRVPANWHLQHGRKVCELHAHGREQVRLIRVPAGAALFAEAIPSAEVLVLSGAIQGLRRTLGPTGWLRLPQGHYPTVCAGEQGATVWVKTGHLTREVGGRA